MQEDVDVVGLSILNGAHDALCRSVVEELRAQGMENVLLIAGGTINQKDAAVLKSAGVAEVFGVGSRFEDIAAFIRDTVSVLTTRSDEIDRGAGYDRAR
jgi:methylmalonyl-CoA mutase C-terminal domain/subunit